jgi:hypothetical protein
MIIFYWRLILIEKSYHRPLAIAGLGDGATEMERRSKHATQFPNVGKEMGPIEFNCCTTRREHHAKHDRNPQPLGSRVDDPSAV